MKNAFLTLYLKKDLNNAIANGGSPIKVGEYHLFRRQTRIGRKPDLCDVVIKNDNSVSSLHATIIYDEQTRYHKILDGVPHGRLSTNGVYVNGVKKLSATLLDGDSIGIGQHILEYKIISEAPDPFGTSAS